MTVAALAWLNIRLGSHSVGFQWGETALLINIALLPGRWVPIATAAGFCLASLIRDRRPTLKFAYNASMSLLSAAAAVAVFEFLDGGRDLFSPRGVFGLAGGAFNFAVVSLLLTSVVVAIAQEIPFRGVLRRGTPVGLLVCTGNVGAAVLMLALARWSPWSLAMLPPMLRPHLAYREHLRARRRTATRGADCLKPPSQSWVTARQRSCTRQPDGPSTCSRLRTSRFFAAWDAGGEAQWLSLAPGGGATNGAGAPHHIHVDMQDTGASLTALRLCFTAPVDLDAEEREALQTFAHWLALEQSPSDGA